MTATTRWNSADRFACRCCGKPAVGGRTHCGCETAAEPCCGFAGCKWPAKWSCRKLWGKGDTLKTCDGHKPDPAKRPAALKGLPFFYEVKPL